MTFGLVIFALGSVIGAVATSIEVLMAGRAVQGLGAAFVLPATLSIVTNVFDREERTKAIAIWTAVGGMGIGFGPAVGGFLVDRWDLSAAFWNRLPAIAIALIGQLFAPESRDEREVGLDVPGAITATLGISVLVFGIIQGTEKGWTSPLIITSFVLAMALLAGFLVIEARAEHPMLPLRFFDEPRLQRVGAHPGHDVLCGTRNVLLHDAVLSDRAWPRPVRGSAAAIAILTTVDADWSALTAIGVVVLFGFGFGLGMPSLTDAVMAAVPVEDAGVGSAVNDVSRELGSALGVAVIGSFISSLCRGNVETELAGRVPDDVIEAAKEGIGVIAATAPSLPADVAQTSFAGASEAFVDALNTGFWLSVAVLLAAVAVAAFMLPNRTREDQAIRLDDKSGDTENNHIHDGATEAPGLEQERVVHGA